jgi:hypothetical protein
MTGRLYDLQTNHAIHSNLMLFACLQKYFRNTPRFVFKSLTNLFCFFQISRKMECAIVSEMNFFWRVCMCVSIWCLLLKSYKVSRVYQASGSSEQVTLDTAGRRGFGVKDSYKPRSIHSTPPPSPPASTE